MEIWNTGKRYFTFNTRQMRSFPVPAAKAEFMIATEQATLVTKPEFLQ